MQSVVVAVFAIGAAIGSGAAIMQYSYHDMMDALERGENPAPAASILNTGRDDERACQPVRFRVYFPKGSTELNEAGKVLVSQAIDNVADCGGVTILLGAPDRQLTSEAQRFTASERSAALLAELQISGLEGRVFVAREKDVFSGPGVYIDPVAAGAPDYIAVAIEPQHTTQTEYTRPEFQT